MKFPIAAGCWIRQLANLRLNSPHSMRIWLDYPLHLFQRSTFFAVYAQARFISNDPSKSATDPCKLDPEDPWAAIQPVSHAQPKRVSLDEFPLPQGSWQESFDRRKRLGSIQLGLGLLFFGGTVFYVRGTAIPNKPGRKTGSRLPYCLFCSYGIKTRSISRRFLDPANLWTIHLRLRAPFWSRAFLEISTTSPRITQRLHPNSCRNMVSSRTWVYLDAINSTTPPHYQSILVNGFWVHLKGRIGNGRVIGSFVLLDEAFIDVDRFGLCNVMRRAIRVW